MKKLIRLGLYFVVLAAICCRPSAHKLDLEKSALFVDITDESKLNFVHDAAVDGSYMFPEVMGAGGAFLDYDNDGRLDIYVVNGQRHGSNNGSRLKNHLYHQEKDGTFRDVTEQAFGSAQTGYGMGAAAGDIDNDGRVDLFVTNYGSVQLFHNNGNGTFTDITKQAGISDSKWATSATFLDYDRDGFLDLYICNYVAYNPAVICTDKAGRKDYCGPQGFRAEPDMLFHNNGNGTFTDVSAQSGIAKLARKGLGVVTADFNQDGFVDIYVANDQEPNLLWVNNHDGTFQDLALPLGAAVNAMGQPEAGMGVTAGDADGDGNFEVFVTNLRDETNTLYHHIGQLGFRDDTGPSNLGPASLPFTGFGTGFFDFDNDGSLDVAVVNGRVIRGPLLTHNKQLQFWDDYSEPNLLFKNDGKGHFTNVSDKAGSFCSDIENSRGLIFGDIDNDGKIDLLVTNDGGPARLFHNNVPQKGHWLTVRVKGWTRDAIGASVVVTAAGKHYKQTANPGYSYLSSNDPRAHFGLGAATSVDEILVQWPDGTDEKFPGVKADQFITLEKGKGKT